MKIRLFTVPNIITCLNLFCGCLAITAAVAGRLDLVFLLILAAAVFDFFDGLAARALGSYSPVGKELDSLADVVSFGVAPSFVLMMTPAMDTESVVKFVVFIVAVFSALRLAKFNIDERQGEEFIGLPTPANAILITSLGYILYTGGNFLTEVIFGSVWSVAAFSAVMSWLLVCEIPMFSFKFKHFRVKGNELRYGFVLFTAVMAAIFAVEAVPVVIVSYIAVSVARNLTLRTKAAGRVK